ncbi:MAG: tRNA (adenosine(37)-N6)-threonylcarbamoyltransferase complex dimerization subunit type 1 TsaB [Rickettsiales bacterium]
MIILALETSGGRCSAAVLREGEIIAYKLLEAVNKQAEESITIISETLTHAGITLQEVDYLAACLGPGSFTGIRVGIAALEGIGLAIEKPIIGVSSLECLACGYSEKIVCALAAGRDQYFVQKFLSGMAVNEISIVDASEMLIYADDAKIIGNFVNQTLPDAKMLAYAAYSYAQNPNFQPAVTLAPIYVREVSIGGKDNSRA